MATTDPFRSFLTTRIAPRMRALGFTGSGNSYVWPDEEYWKLVGFQRDRYFLIQPRFTVNVSEVTKASWEAERARHGGPPRPHGNTWHLETETWFRRLGHLMPQQDDTWWGLAADDDRDAVAATVADAIATYVLPLMRGDNGCSHRLHFLWAAHRGSPIHPDVRDATVDGVSLAELCWATFGLVSAGVEQGGVLDAGQRRKLLDQVVSFAEIDAFLTAAQRHHLEGLREAAALLLDGSGVQ